MQISIDRGTLIIKVSGIDGRVKLREEVVNGPLNPEKVLGNRLTVNQGGIIRNSKLTEDGWMCKKGIKILLERLCLSNMRNMLSSNLEIDSSDLSRNFP